MVSIPSSFFPSIKAAPLYVRELLWNNCNKGRVGNIYILTMQKSGSQWISAILADPKVVDITGLKRYPQFRYEYGEFVGRFPVGTFVPGLYMSFDLYEEIKKPADYRAICIVRDPRNILVSWYFSMLKTHALIGKVRAHRQYLERVNVSQGLHYSIDQWAVKFASMRTWVSNSIGCNEMKIFYFEEIVSNPVVELERIMNHCNYSISCELSEYLSTKYSKDNMRQSDLEQRRDKAYSHYRHESSDHFAYFTADHYEHFHDVAGNLLNVLGYDN